MKPIRIPVQELRPGMYVAAPDRPWLETPFLFQGFLVQDESEIAEFRRVCKHVYIDPAQSQIAESPTPNQPDIEADTPRGEDPGQLLQTSTRRKSFHEQLRQAADARELARRQLRRMFQQTRLGKQIDMDQTRVIVREVVGNILEYPDAALWLTQLKNRDDYTCLHSLNVCMLTIAFCRHLGLESQTDLEQIGQGALLHDIGKALVPNEVLNKPDQLSPEELRLVRRHPEDGYELMRRQTNLPDPSLAIIRHHHERLNGQGYPDGLVGAELDPPVLATAVCDIYDAITSDRSYHSGIAADEALRLMRRNAENTLGEGLIDEFVNFIGIYPVGSTVELNNRAIAIVVGSSRSHRLLPKVLLVRNARGEAVKKRSLVDLAKMNQEADDSAWQIARVIPPSHAPLDTRQIILSEVYDPITAIGA